MQMDLSRSAGPTILPANLWLLRVADGVLRRKLFIARWSHRPGLAVYNLIHRKSTSSDVKHKFAAWLPSRDMTRPDTRQANTLIDDQIIKNNKKTEFNAI